MNTMNPNTHTYTDTPTTTTTATTTMPTTSQSSEDSNTNVNSSTAVPECDGEIEVFGDFEAMDLQENLLRGIFSYGLEKPSAIQTKGIVPTAKGKTSTPPHLPSLRPFSPLPYPYPIPTSCVR